MQATARTRRFAIGCGLMVVAAACGGSADRELTAAGDESVTTVDADTDRSVTLIDVDGDRAAVAKALEALEDRLRKDGFHPEPPDDEDDDDGFDKDDWSEECRDFADAFPDGDDRLPGETASDGTADFQRGELDLSGGIMETINADLTMVEAADQLDVVFEFLEDDRTLGCFDEVFTLLFEAMASEDDDGPQMAVSGLRVRYLDVAGVGDDTVGLSVDATIGANGLEWPFRVDAAFARHDRMLAEVVVTTVGADEGQTDPAELLAVLLDEAEDLAK
jgi:hypothetical protein